MTHLASLHFRSRITVLALSFFILPTAGAVDLRSSCKFILKIAANHIDFTRLEETTIRKEQARYADLLKTGALTEAQNPKTAEEKLGLLLASRKLVAPLEPEVDLKTVTKSRLSTRALRKELSDLDFTKNINVYDLVDVYSFLQMKSQGDPRGIPFLLRKGWKEARQGMRNLTYEKKLARNELKEHFESLGKLEPPKGLKKLSELTERYSTPIEIALTAMGLVPLLSLGPPAHMPKFSLLSYQGKDKELHENAKKVGFKNAYDALADKHRFAENVDLRIKLSERILHAWFIAFLGVSAYQQAVPSDDEAKRRLQHDLEEFQRLGLELQAQLENAKLETETNASFSSPDELKRNIRFLKKALDDAKKNSAAGKALSKTLEKRVNKARVDIEKAGLASLSGWSLLLMRKKGITILSRFKSDPLFAGGGLLLGGGGAGLLGAYGVSLDLQKLDEISKAADVVRENHAENKALRIELEERLKLLQNELKTR